MTRLEEFASLLSQTDVSALGSVGLVVIVAAISALVWLRRRLPNRSIERADLSMWEAEVCAHIGHQALDDEAIERGTRRLWADLHDVEDSDD